MEFFATNSPGRAGENRSAASDALTREILEHQEEEKNRSYLSKLAVGASEYFHGNQKSLEHMDALRQSAMLSKMSGDEKGVEAAGRQAQSAVAQDRDSRRSAESWSNHSSNFLKSVGVFFPGKPGYAMAAIAGAADAAHPSDSPLRQGVDLALGAGKGAVMKLAFDEIAGSRMHVALKAGAMSISNRLADVGLDSHTYFDRQSGEFSLLSGLEKAGMAAADPRQLGMDLLTFGGGYLMMSKLGVTPELTRVNPRLAQIIAAAGFGFSSGFFSDMQAQQRLGGEFKMDSALKSAFLQMGLDGTAAVLGCYRQHQLESAIRQEPEAIEPHAAVQNSGQSESSGLDRSMVEGVYGLDNRPVARHHSMSIDDTAPYQGQTIRTQG
jgi:hypothetical protein